MTSFKCKVFSDSRNSLERKNLSEESYVRYELKFSEDNFRYKNKSTIFTDLIREEGSFKSTRLNQSYKNGEFYFNSSNLTIVSSQH